MSNRTIIAVHDRRMQKDYFTYISISVIEKSFSTPEFTNILSVSSLL